MSFAKSSDAGFAVDYGGNKPISDAVFEFVCMFVVFLCNFYFFSVLGRVNFRKIIGAYRSMCRIDEDEIYQNKAQYFHIWIILQKLYFYPSKFFYNIFLKFSTILSAVWSFCETEPIARASTSFSKPSGRILQFSRAKDTSFFSPGWRSLFFAKIMSK